MAKPFTVLIINPGSTSTKIALFKDDKEVFNRSLKHSIEQLEQFDDIWEQYDFRKEAILSELEREQVSLKELDAICCRGGNVKPIPGGIYLVNEAMLQDLKGGQYGQHPCDVGNVIAYDLGRELNIPVVTVDPPVSDELEPLARYSGHRLIPRVSSFHALNQKATARKLAADLGKSYDQLNLIIVHLGGGISVGAHRRGKVIDVNNALYGDGPFSPERTGSLPVGALVELCFSGRYTKADVMKMINGAGGLMSYLGTKLGLEVEERIGQGDRLAQEVFEAMAYQTAKEIGAQAAVLEGKVDAIGLTGSLAYSDRFVAYIKSRVSFIAPVYLYPGENEMQALADGALRFLRGEEEAKNIPVTLR